MLKLLCATAIFLYILSEVFTKMDITIMISSVSLAIVALTFFIVPRFVKILGGIFLTSGLFMLINSGAGWKEVLLSFGPMLNLLTLFAMVPILALPIKLGNYAKGIQKFIRRNVKTSGQLYSMTSGISYFFSIFMNLATLPMTYYSMRPAANMYPLQNRERFMSRAITHGFAMPLMWAPVTPIVGIVVEMTGVSWASMLPYVLPLSIMGLLLDWYMGRLTARKKRQREVDYAVNEMAASTEVGEEQERSGKISHIFIAIIIFNVLISILEQKLTFSFIILVSLLVIPFALGWTMFLKKTKDFKIGLKDHFQTHLLKMKEQFFIFLAAGFFISAIQFSDMNVLLNAGIGAVKDLIGSEVFIILLPFIPLALAFTGLHPAVGLALLAEALDPKNMGISPYVLTVSMLAGAVAAFLMGPYNATIGLMSSIVKTNSFKVSNWNISFTALFLCCSMLYLILLEFII
ncbi:hypothetical protein [Alkalihalobacillus sp. TS-13]|uniref:hypothetical protein n=1 Tax=Alkalihalobacillus sp. TS-13 TaxID=2842455 RepID=UPI001C8768D1|nr:hypothetical protein [Alkalihalobacillus sp. TS-13]